MGKRKQVRVGPPPTTTEEFGDALLAAAPGDADRLAPGFTLPAELASAADRAGQQLIGRACRGGWLPEDLQQAARRRLDEFAGSYLLDTLVAYAGQFTAVHPDWLAQLDALGAGPWWTATEPHLPQWAAKHILTPS